MEDPQEMHLPDPQLAQRLFAHTNRPDWVWPQLQSDRDLLATCVQLIDINYPFLTQFGFHDKGADWMGPCQPPSVMMTCA